jgi:hypothetical protein
LQGTAASRDKAILFEASEFLTLGFALRADSVGMRAQPFWNLVQHRVIARASR